MESLRELYRIGFGPSSSHTMGPRKATEIFFSENKNCVNFEVELYGSLAATGKGHMTDKAIENVFKNEGKNVKIVWNAKTILPRHPNALKISGFDKNSKKIKEEIFYSVGGGRVVRGDEPLEPESVYPQEFHKMSDILLYCEEEGLGIWEICRHHVTIIPHRIIVLVYFGSASSEDIHY